MDAKTALQGVIIASDFALILTNEDLAHSAQAPRPSQKEQERLTKTPLNFFTLGEFADFYLRTQDEEVGRHISSAALPAAQAAVDLFLKQSELVTMGFAPHHQSNILYAAHLSDFAFADPRFGEGNKKRLRAQLAFLSYLVHRADYRSPARGFVANPNMTSMVAGYQGFLACLLNDHPEAKKWLDISLDELFTNELLTWSDDNGGWLEAPHYATLGYDYILGVFLCARNAGRPEHLNHSRMQKIIEWLAKITTPPDARMGGRRHLPPIGNTYMLEPTGEFGTVAYLWQRTDPDFSARMQWMHAQSGKEISPGVGGFWPATAPYQRVFKDLSLPSKLPGYGSELFPRTGVILRAHLGYDSGSVTLWGKGRLLADDFGYYGQAPAEDHSLVDTPGVRSVMLTESFVTQYQVDLFEGRSGSWARRIEFLKNSDPESMNYFVLRDDVAGDTEGIWRLWLTAERIELGSQRVHLVGKDDVDMDIFFLNGQPQDVWLETKTRKSASSFFNNSPFETTQTEVDPVGGTRGRGN